MTYMPDPFEPIGEIEKQEIKEAYKRERPDFKNIDFYKGFKIHINNRIPNIRVNRRFRYIEKNTTFFDRLTQSQQFYLLAQMVYMGHGHSVMKADKLAFDKAKRMGYDLVEITQLFNTMKGRKKHLQKRWYLLITEGTSFESRVESFFNDMRQWILKKCGL